MESSLTKQDLLEALVATEERLEVRFTKIDERFDRVDARIDGLSMEIRRNVDDLALAIQALAMQLDERFAHMHWRPNHC